MIGTRSYRVIVKPDEDGFRAIVPAFPHIFTCGDNVDEALAMAKDAIELEIRVAGGRADNIPEPDGDSVVRVEHVLIVLPAA